MESQKAIGSFSFLNYQSFEVSVGNVILGGSNPVRIQSMTNTDTKDVDATLAQIEKLVAAGCEMIRIAAPGIKDANALADIKRGLETSGMDIPLIADIHFLPEAALVAAEIVDKVRINPGNYIRSEDTDIRDEAFQNLKPLVERCKDHNTSIRIGVNHGSLSKRILNKYGNTSRGMVVSLLEYLEVFEALYFKRLVLSLKASNPQVCMHANRLLANALLERGTPYPLHLGVTEAGSGVQGMITSIAGIGPLLQDGLGDTIRVSLTGDPQKEIPLARKVVDWYESSPRSKKTMPYSWDPLKYYRRTTEGNILLGGDHLPCIVIPENIYADSTLLEDGEKPDAVFAQDGSLSALTVNEGSMEVLPRGSFIKLSLSRSEDVPLVRRVISNLIESGDDRPVMIHLEGIEDSFKCCALASPFVIEGLADAWLLDAPALISTLFELLQATRRRVTRTTYIACPSCARTQFDIEGVLEEVKQETSHLKGLTIAVMGCIVNGPGEMAGADYGYVGAGPGKVNLYRGDELVMKQIPEKEAISHLLKLIEADTNK